MAEQNIMAGHILTEQNYSLKALRLDVAIEGQKAVACLIHELYNPADRPVEVEYMISLPAEGNVAGLILLLNGQEVKDELYDRKEAFALYKEIVRKAKDPALLEYAGQGLFRARIFPLPFKSSVKLELKCEMLLEQDNGQVELNFPLAGPLSQGRMIKEQEVNVWLKSKAKSIYSPPCS